MSKRLSEPTLDKIKPDPNKRLEIPDTVAGLYFIVQPSGRRSWALRYRQFGRTRKLTLGGFPQFKLGEARSAAKAFLERIDRGEDPATDKQIDKRRRLRGEGIDQSRFDNVARLFIARHAKEKTKSWLTTANRLGLVPDKTLADRSDDPLTFVVRKGSAVDKWGHRPIETIERREIISYLDDLISGGMGAGANRIRAALSKLFNWAITRDLIELNPCDKVDAPAVETSRDRVLDDAEIKVIWNASMNLSKQELGRPFGPAFRLLMLTAQRRDEVISMKWSEIDFVKKQWIVPAARSKNKKANVVHLSAAAMDILKNTPRLKGSDLVFTTNGHRPISGLSRAKRNLDADVIAIMKQEAAKRGDDVTKVELPEWRIHDFRRTAASGMARLGIRLEVIEKILNHQSGVFAGVAGVYQRFEFSDERTGALETWSRFVTSLVSDQPTNVVPIAGRGA
ncbi:site-specific integrase [Mesorhizobium sp. M0185]|uniref:tyrosine-type recombinase/integrase n=1 Tax=Mesorhizobium sp. M0185 TaxID=2956907 RepID=UPI003339EE3E